LPKGVFAPYTSIKTNLLFFTKGEPTKNVWFYEHPYPEGAKSYSKTKPLTIKEFDPEKNWWSKRKENDQAWKVSLDDIKARGYNLDIKNPRAVDDGPGDADELLAQYKQAAEEAARIRDHLRDQLRAALEGGPCVPTSGETVPPRYLCTQGRRMVSRTCPSHPAVLVVKPLRRRTSASSARP